MQNVREASDRTRNENAQVLVLKNFRKKVEITLS
jgi:hypothetical protein